MLRENKWMLDKDVSSIQNDVNCYIPLPVLNKEYSKEHSQGENGVVIPPFFFSSLCIIYFVSFCVSSPKHSNHTHRSLQRSLTKKVSMLFYWGALQFLVQKMGWLLWVAPSFASTHSSSSSSNRPKWSKMVQNSLNSPSASTPLSSSSCSFFTIGEILLLIACYFLINILTIAKAISVDELLVPSSSAFSWSSSSPSPRSLATTSFCFFQIRHSRHNSCWVNERCRQHFSRTNWGCTVHQSYYWPTVNELISDKCRFRKWARLLIDHQSCKVASLTGRKAGYMTKSWDGPTWIMSCPQAPLLIKPYLNTMTKYSSCYLN